MNWLNVMEYLCHKWPWICSTCRKHFPVLFSFKTYFLVCYSINTTGATNGAETAYSSGAPEFTPGFSGVHVIPSLVLYVCFVDCCLYFCTFSFGHCFVCSSSIYGLWLPLWYLQTPLLDPKLIQETNSFQYFIIYIRCKLQVYFCRLSTCLF
jgi:hypothetical protein